MTTAALDARTFVLEGAHGDAEVVDFLEELRRRGLDAPEATARLVGKDGQSIELPDELFQVLKLAAESLASGRAISVAPLDKQLTTMQAADFLGMSRPTLIKIVDGGEIPCTKVGRHRRVLLRDLVAYQEKAKRERRAALDEMVDLAIANDLYDLTGGDAEGIR